MWQTSRSGFFREVLGTLKCEGVPVPCDPDRSELRSEYNRKRGHSPLDSDISAATTHGAGHTVPAAGSVHSLGGKMDRVTTPCTLRPREMGCSRLHEGERGLCRQVRGLPSPPPPLLSSCTLLWSQTHKHVQIHIHTDREHACIHVHTGVYTQMHDLHVYTQAHSLTRGVFSEGSMTKSSLTAAALQRNPDGARTMTVSYSPSQLFVGI